MSTVRCNLKIIQTNSVPKQLACHCSGGQLLACHLGGHVRPHISLFWICGELICTRKYIPLSVPFHHYSTLIFIYILLLNQKDNRAKLVNLQWSYSLTEIGKSWVKITFTSLFTVANMSPAVQGHTQTNSSFSWFVIDKFINRILWWIVARKVMTVILRVICVTNHFNIIIAPSLWFLTSPQLSVSRHKTVLLHYSGM